MSAVEYKKEGKIAIITLNRPEALNALNTQLRTELQAALEDVRDNNDVFVTVVTGAGDRAFSAGADIKEFSPTRRLRPDLLRLDQIWKPFIAAIHGFCLGGGLELALTCDLRIAAENSRFGTPEIKVGVIPGGGGISRLPRFISRSKAAEILLLGDHIDAQEAYRIGLVNKVVPRDQLMPAAMAWANRICELGPLMVRAVKEAMIRGYDMTLPESLTLEKDFQRYIRSTEDHMEGARAFIEKRKPNWKLK
jgi:enoyl-CoA hydratase/carnithine racemase